MKKLSVAVVTVLMFQLLLYPLTSAAQTLIVNDFTKATPKNTPLSFEAKEFVANANPPGGKSLISVRIDQLTDSAAGSLQLNEDSVSKGAIISIDALNRLVFVPVSDYEGEAIFTWTAIYGSAQSPYPGAVVITVGSGTETPSVIPSEDGNTQEGEALRKEPFSEFSEEQTTQRTQKNDSDENNRTEHETDTSESRQKNTDSEQNKNENFAQTNELKPLRYEDMLSHWGAYSAGMLASRGYVIGEDFGNDFYFHPEEKINRFEFVLMVNAVFGIKPTDSLSDNPFSDKNVPAYVMRVGIAAYDCDIIAGTKGKDGLLYFNPYDTVTRAEAITIVDYALRLDTYGVDKTEFKDSNQIPSWALQSVQNLEAYGIIQGCEDNTIRPLDSITRAQAAEMVWQALKFLDAKRTANAVFTTLICGD